MSAIKNVNKSDYKNAIADYTLKWKLTDLFLRDLCSNKYHLHIKEDIVKAKMIIIARSFSSGIERQIRIRKKIKNRRQGEAMDILTTLFYTNGEDVDNIISSINECNTFNEKAIYQICEGHTKLCNILKEITRTSKNGKKYIPISFASKYLHFHCPIVPIYDSFANSSIWNMIYYNQLSLIEKPTICNDIYFDYCKAILEIYNELIRIKAVPNPTVRFTEYYVMYNS